VSTDHSKVHELIRDRWSPRAFSEKEVAPEDLEIILDAAHWAASSFNEQPWRFIVATKKDPTAYQKLLSVLVPFNQDWAKPGPVVILIAAKKTFTHNQNPNRYALHDAGAALTTLFLQATALGMHAHGMAGLDYDKARTELQIPEDFEIAACTALGYLGSPDQLPEGLQKQETATRQRRPLSEVAFTTSWQTPYPFN